MLPTMLVIGARKSATGTLWGYLDQHPETFLARPKELHFFDRDANYRRGERWYAAHFPAAAVGAARAIGEATPGTPATRRSRTCPSGRPR